MKKYDCNKTLDYIHELARMCHSFPGCKDDCPLRPICYGFTHTQLTTQEHVNIVQKWSDEHPEQPKLTERDYSFLNCFSPVDKYIRRQYGVLSIIWYDPMITIGAMEIPIDVTMFKCVEKGQKWSFEDLLKLEVDVSDANVGKMEKEDEI